ncbi:arachidonate 5-lipoxygenase-like [Asterias rubens]|uniref:arachidonate 5-lipoxygenase-like n=1 Tax=Asterias rubens TaxID=7604 RepID=UPI0014553273|nr:arachidonate 5-lipoxygenase-like [Asterias rubens]
MGNACVSGTSAPPDFVILVKTGDYKGAGTNADVYVALYNEDGVRSRDILLDCRWKDDTERGSLGRYPVTNLPNFGLVSKLEVWRNSTGLGDSWFLERVEVVPETSGDSSVFPIHRWIPADKKRVFGRNDCVLPQCDERKDDRKKELAEKKKLYELECKAEGLIPQVKNFPEDESFSDDYKWDIVKNKAGLLLQSKLINLQTDEWKTLEDIGKVYNKHLPVPYGMNNWRSDLEFGSQRLVSCNPTQIRLCTEIPDNFAITDDMIKPLIDDMTLQEAMECKKLFIMNYSILKDLKCSYDRKICAPLGLFYVNKSHDLVPVAIQLFQDPCEDNPVFLPTDPEYTWLLAKLWFNNADASFHQSATHLGFTHLIIESVAVATHRCLSPSHPIFRLLAPHFLYLIAINYRALAKLVSEDGWVDQCMGIGRIGMFDIIARTATKWRLNVEGTLPTDLNMRGVDDPEVLPKYYFRDDALLLFEIIEKYVSEVVNGNYDDSEKLRDDEEIQELAEILSKPSTEGGAGIQGVHGNGKFATNAELIGALTAIIYTSSVAHAAANFSQYDEYAFPPNYPSIMRDAEPPKDKSPRTEQDIVNCLPNKEKTISIMVVTKILSDRGTNGLGDFEVEYQFDDVGKKAVESFRKELIHAGDVIDERNVTRASPYTYLHPKEVPNAISI